VLGGGRVCYRVPVGPAIPGHIISLARQSGPLGLCQRPANPKRFLLFSGLSRCTAVASSCCCCCSSPSHDDSAATSTIHGPSATPAKGPLRTKATPATPSAFGAAVARNPHHVWTLAYTALEIASPALPITCLSAPSNARPSRSKCWPTDRLQVCISLYSSY
jgi:hypothetical protein